MNSEKSSKLKRQIRNAARSVGCAMWMFAATGEASAQVPIQPVPQSTCQNRQVSADLETLTESYLKGRWSEVVQVLAAVAKALDAPCLNKTNPHIVFVWPGFNALGDRVLLSALYPSSQPFGSALPGVTGGERPDDALFEVFLAPVPDATLNSAYLASREADPFVAVASSAIEKNLEKLVSGVAGLSGGLAKMLNVNDASKPAPPRSFASVALLHLPYSRGKLIVKRRASLPSAPRSVRETFEKLAEDVKLREARDSEPARSMVDAYVKIVESALGADDCIGSAATADTCRSSLARLMSIEYLKRLPTSATEQSTLLAADKRFREQVAALTAAKIDQESTINNEPKTRLSMGTLVGFLTNAYGGRPRVKVGGAGELVADPLPRTLTSVIVNWAPQGFMASSADVEPAERVRLFAGVAVTPNVGVTAGVAVQLFKGFSVAPGIAYLALPTGTIGATASSPRPFRTSWSWAPFVGASFSLK